MLVQCAHPALFQPKFKINLLIKFRSQILMRRMCTKTSAFLPSASRSEPGPGAWASFGAMAVLASSELIAFSVSRPDISVNDYPA